MSFSEWLTWFRLHQGSAVTAFLALVIFLWLYGTARRRAAFEEHKRLEHLKNSLELYAAAIAALMRALDKPVLSGAGKRLLLNKLLALRAAPYATENALAQVSAYAADGDAARLELLLKTLERESEQLIAERDKLLRQMEQPGWGQWLWRYFRPSLPFLFAAGLFFTFLWLLRLVDEFTVATGEGPDRWRYWASWIQLVSTWLALGVFYPASMSLRRKSASSALARILAALIAIFALFHLAGYMFAPYILGLQLLLFSWGYRLNGRKPRKSRPYVGHPSAASGDSSGSDGGHPDAKKNDEPRD
ncbi:hypothetical protein [Paenibacillus macerans]|uniref:hypothetical protein n=1 Tax=Paenibacillus macerans TaxID=44252 RepID=UPI00203C03B1|nr:hypothetical protein [Paenibacillus macerans]MCM3701827.1 hypothetical protein [Paenibacillus macerans]